jgi:hypothetical protein
LHLYRRVWSKFRYGNAKNQPPVGLHVLGRLEMSAISDTTQQYKHDLSAHYDKKYIFKGTKIKSSKGKSFSFAIL